tara:strand:+ start:1115 stop:1861 length:747 start_codon:yes stop_codon:yes gene_type:complete
MFVDVHTHVTDAAFDKDRKEVIERSGCIAIINNGYTPEDNRATLKLAKEFPNVKVALGLHPSETCKMDPKAIENEINFISGEKPIAIGEIGLDGTYENMGQQVKYFKHLVDLAMKKGLPMIVHSRKAEKEVIDILEEMKAKKVLLHCFTGKLKLAERAEKLGFYLSIPPLIVYSTHFQELAKRVSITKLLTETDAPYLGPFKDKRNEPGNVTFTVKKIAELKGMNEDEVEKSIYMNYQKLFISENVIK